MAGGQSGEPICIGVSSYKKRYPFTCRMVRGIRFSGDQNEPTEKGNMKSCEFEKKLLLLSRTFSYGQPAKVVMEVMAKRVSTISAKQNISFQDRTFKKLLMLAGSRRGGGGQDNKAFQLKFCLGLSCPVSQGKFPKK